jgi:nucleoside-diphosphate-sugar epimerase
MKIFVAGATGTIGRRLVPLLVEAGHEVTGMTRRPAWAALPLQGAAAVACDVYDRPRLFELLAAMRPEIVIDELSDLRTRLGPRGSDAELAANRRIRTEGVRNLVDAAVAAGARRVIAQSYAHVYAPAGGWVKGEDDPMNLGLDAPTARRHNVESVWRLEQTVLDTAGVEGVALRYGALYGPRTPFARAGSVAAEFHRQRYPIVGDGEGRTSFVHVDDAARATVLALEAPPGVYNVCDDHPAAQVEWAPYYAALVGAPPPRHVSSLGVVTRGREHFVFRATRQRGASNQKARAVLGWELRYPSWREGFLAEAVPRPDMVPVAA